MVWKPGCESPNPSGRPAGTPNKRTQLAKLFEPHAPALINKCVELALAGDTNALRLAIERLIPRAKDEPIPFYLPTKLSAESFKDTIEGILRSLECADITPEQAKTLFDVIKGYRDNFIAEELLDEYKELLQKFKAIKENNNRPYVESK